MTSPLASHLLAQQATAADHFWYRVRARAINRFIPANSTVLDVGAGAGSLGLILRRERPDVRYLFREPDPELRAVLQSTFGAAGEGPVGTAFTSPSCAVLLDVIEHVEDDVALLRGIAAELPVGSIIAVTVPAHMWLWSGWDTTVGHYRRYNRKQAAASLRNAGLRVVAAQYIFPELVPVGVARKVLRLDGGEDFPPIGRLTNRILWTIGVVTQRLGRANPFGTSVVAAGVVERT